MTEEKNESPINWIKILFGTTLALCALSLALIAINLRPLAIWANYQSACIEKESSKAPIEWAVRKCNGRSKVYQVK
ncbi:hypothetical protein [Prochlorococcus sp. MIT 1223]|uniref:hypothetical protein n=1 Tax=Prochlorococcus sp. MIT 1223 TaxID=3096217 RepID=UPI002A74E106|nr:hypothetical protein [Prochlorococcus sp. MIT 1223]